MIAKLLLSQTFPLRIKPSHKLIFLFSAPALNLFLSRDRTTSAIEAFVVNASIDFVSFCKASR